MLVWRLKVLTLEKKNDKRCVGRIWHVEKKKGIQVDLEKEVNIIVVNNEEEKDIDGLEEK